MAEYIYDRTAADVSNGTPKGYINYTDLNRIENAMEELEAELNAYAYPLGEKLTIKTDWKRQIELAADSLENIPTLEHLTRLLHNEAKLIASFFVYPDTPTLPASLEYATFETFNDVEKILYDLHLMLESLRGYFRECNTFYCGGADIV